MKKHVWASLVLALYILKISGIWGTSSLENFETPEKYLGLSKPCKTSDRKKCSPSLLDFPDHILLNILGWMNGNDLVRLSQTCKTVNAFCHQSAEYYSHYTYEVREGASISNSYLGGALGLKLARKALGSGFLRDVGDDTKDFLCLKNLWLGQGCWVGPSYNELEKLFKKAPFLSELSIEAPFWTSNMCLMLAGAIGELPLKTFALRYTGIGSERYTVSGSAWEALEQTLAALPLLQDLKVQRCRAPGRELSALLPRLNHYEIVELEGNYYGARLIVHHFPVFAPEMASLPLQSLVLSHAYVSAWEAPKLENLFKKACYLRVVDLSRNLFSFGVSERIFDSFIGLPLEEIYLNSVIFPIETAKSLARVLETLPLEVFEMNGPGEKEREFVEGETLLTPVLIGLQKCPSLKKLSCNLRSLTFASRGALVHLLENNALEEVNFSWAWIKDVKAQDFLRRAFLKNKTLKKTSWVGMNFSDPDRQARAVAKFLSEHPLLEELALDTQFGESQVIQILSRLEVQTPQTLDFRGLVVPQELFVLKDWYSLPRGFRLKFQDRTLEWAKKK